MKIRTGFVSNSSSTSYVIALTRDFKPTPKQIKDFIQECNDYNEDDDNDKDIVTKENAVEIISGIVEELCKNGELSWYEGEDVEIDNFVPFMSACSDSFEICAVNGGHGCDSLANILADDIKDKTTEIMKLCKFGEK